MASPASSTASTLARDLFSIVEKGLWLDAFRSATLLALKFCAQQLQESNFICLY
jgi:hypothetical protein